MSLFKDPQQISLKFDLNSFKMRIVLSHNFWSWCADQFERSEKL